MATEQITETVVCYCGLNISNYPVTDRVVECKQCYRLWGNVEGEEWRLLIPHFPARSRTANEIKNQIFLCKRCNGPTEFIGIKHRVRCLNTFCQYEWYETSQGVSLFENQLKHRRQELQKKMIELDSDSEEYAKCLQELIEIQEKAKAVKEEKL